MTSGLEILCEYLESDATNACVEILVARAQDLAAWRNRNDVDPKTGHPRLARSRANVLRLGEALEENYSLAEVDIGANNLDDVDRRRMMSIAAMKDGELKLTL